MGQLAGLLSFLNTLIYLQVLEARSGILMCHHVPSSLSSLLHATKELLSHGFHVVVADPHRVQLVDFVDETVERINVDAVPLLRRAASGSRSGRGRSTRRRSWSGRGLLLALALGIGVGLGRLLAQSDGLGAGG